MSTRKQRDSTLAEPRPSTPAPALRDGGDAPRIDLAEARKALDAELPTLEALPEGTLLHVNFSLDQSASVALGVVARCEEPALHARLMALAASGLWSFSSVATLRKAALAAYYVGVRAEESDATNTAATVSPATLAQGKTLRARMAKVLTFCLGDDPEIAPTLRHLKQARSHRAQANALQRYAELYDEHHALVSRAPKHYQPGDVAMARTVAQTMLTALDANHDGSPWLSLRARAATRLVNAYEEVAEAARFIERATPAARALRFPSIVASGRAPRRRKTAKAPVTPTHPTPPAP